MEASQDPVFRPNKRRKIFKKRSLHDEPGENELSDGRAEPNTRNEDLDSVNETRNQPVSTVRRPASKKHGINFSSGAAANQAATTQTALVPVQQEDPGVLSTDRFTKPTGNVGVVEDKHLTAYVDSKLAELRSSSATPYLPAASPISPGRHTPDDHSSSRYNDDTSGSNALSVPEQDAAQSALQDQRKGHPYGSRNRKPRRQPHTRDASDVARDAMVDAIMRESQVPLYDQSADATPGIDNDEAAEHAFKAQFLLDLESKKRRKAPVPAGTEKTSSGPKLGGSRSQREKMRALEEAKNAPPKK